MDSLTSLRHLYAILGFDELRQAIDDYERLIDAHNDASHDLPHSNDTEHMANEPSPSDPAVNKSH